MERPRESHPPVERTENGSGGPLSRAVSPLAVLVASGLANLYLVFGTVILGSAAILFAWVPPRGRAIQVCGRLWARGLLWTSGVQLDVSFEAELDPQRSYVFMPNHQGMYDIPVLLLSLPTRAAFMAKTSLFRIPIFGWALSAGGFIPVDRSDRSHARETFNAAIGRLRGAASVVIFPEETRSPDGRLLPFRRGGLLLALKSGMPIVPVGISGTRNVRRKGEWTVRPGRVEVRYGEPMDVREAGVRHKNEIMRRLRREVARLAGLEAGSERDHEPDWRPASEATT